MIEREEVSLQESLFENNDRGKDQWRVRQEIFENDIPVRRLGRYLSTTGGGGGGVGSLGRRAGSMILSKRFPRRSRAG